MNKTLMHENRESRREAEWYHSRCDRLGNKTVAAPRLALSKDGKIHLS
jgi:hypothetical protein